MGGISRGKTGIKVKRRADVCGNAGGGEAGLTLLELIVACSILMVLATVAMPMARVSVVRHKEETLRYDLREMRDAIDHYKDDADKNLIQVQAGTEGYPPDLQTLVDGVQLTSAQDKDKKVRYLREIPKDPMTGNQDWGLAIHARRSRFEVVGWARCVRCIQPVIGYGARWDELFGLVTGSTLTRGS